MSLFAPEPKVSSSSVADWIQAHCDGGSRGNPGPSGFGAVVVDAHGQKLAELSEFLGIRTNNYAEYSGLLAVLRWALEHGHSRLKVVSDSELMVKQIQGKYKVNSPDLKPLWQEARERIGRLEAFEISHALRHKNKDADLLANQAMDRGSGSRRSEEKAAHAPKQESLRTPLRLAAQPASAGAPARAGHKAAAAGPNGTGLARDNTGRTDAPAMLRGFTRGGAVHLLGGATLPDGIFVKIIRE